MSDFVRVKDKTTGHKYSVRKGSVRDSHEVVNEAAVDQNGHALPAKHNVNPRQSEAPVSTPSASSSDKKEGSK